MIGSVIAFCVVAGMLAIYTLLDGYTLGAGAISLILAKTRAERSAIVESVAPFWSGNEVWLVAAGGTLFALFPKAYAVSFSGFYLPFIVLLWLLMFRGIAIELREHVPANMWVDFWDATFSIASLLLVLLLGVALGNLVRGLPLKPDGYFAGTFSGLLNPYAVSAALLGAFAIVQHGLAYVAENVDGPLSERSMRAVGRTWWLTFAAYLVVTVATITHYSGDSVMLPIAAAASTLAFGALVVLRYAAVRRQSTLAYRASTAFLGGLLLAAIATMYPYLIRPLPGSGGGLTIFDVPAPPVTLAVSLVIAMAGLAAVVAYAVFVRRKMVRT